MSCIAFDIKPVQQATLAIKTATSGSDVAATQQAELTVLPAKQATLTIGEVCTVSRGTIVVLAASDGPLRTRDGGYFLLNPATNQPGA